MVNRCLLVLEDACFEMIYILLIVVIDDLTTDLFQKTTIYNKEFSAF
jgi:hypothetical protein